MYKPKEAVEEYLDRKLRDIVLDRKTSSKYYEECMDKYGIPGGLVADYAMGNKSLGEANPFVLFCLIDCIPENMRKKGYSLFGILPIFNFLCHHCNFLICFQ